MIIVAAAIATTFLDQHKIVCYNKTTALLSVISRAKGAGNRIRVYLASSSTSSKYLCFMRLFLTSERANERTHTINDDGGFLQLALVVVIIVERERERESRLVLW